MGYKTAEDAFAGIPGLKEKWESGYYNNVYMDPELRSVLNGYSGDKLAQGNQSPDGPKITMYGSGDERLGEGAARNNASIYYGTSEQLGKDAADYRTRIKSKLDQPSGLANQFTQASNNELDRANAKAGMSGVGSSAASIREKRNSMAKADTIEQQYDQTNLMNYGKSIGAGISGTESLAATGAGRAIASKPGEVPSYGGGMFGSIICTELYRQRKLTVKELVGCRNFGEKLSPETYTGYLFLARPIVKLMKRSDKFSDLFIGWAKSISRGEPNGFTRMMLPVCTFIGTNFAEKIYAR